jgi:transcription-repair coupling factor (superfamily II helicase)
MKINELTEHYSSHPLMPSLLETVNDGHSGKIRIDGLSGSAMSLVLAVVFHKSQTTHLIVLPEKEDAAYFYNDLLSSIGEDSVFFFPSTYKRSVQYEQTEPANIVLRTEVLNHLASGKRKGIIITYPESVMEKVVSRRNLKKNTFNISKGDKISLEFLEEILHEYNFVRTDFVYEPGQYSIRGSIADVFSYSADLPFRIDFFGEEVETLRSFNTDDQLSTETHKQISVIPNIQDISIEEINDSFTDFLPPSSMIWVEDAGYIKEKINNIFFQTKEREESGNIAGKKDIVMTGNHFIDHCSKFRIVEFGRRGIWEPEAKFEFRTETQPVFNKNFELLTGKLLANNSDGYNTYIISESASQIERLRDIFSEINPEVHFISLLLNLHGGFTDHDLKISVFTDHQIFDRYHKFRIRGYFTRKESISVKELTGCCAYRSWYRQVRGAGKDRS